MQISRLIQHVRSLLVGLIILFGQFGCITTVTVQDVEIVAADTDGNPTSTIMPLTVAVSVLNHNSGCDYRLEFVTPDDSDGALKEVGGNQGPAQRFENVVACAPPSFVQTPATSMRMYQEQTIYYWAKRARDYAISDLWIEPAGWTGGDIKRTPGALGLNLLTRRSFDDIGCFDGPNHIAGQSGCMRSWPHEGPVLNFLSDPGVVAAVRPDLVAHEFGHYAAGYVFGHMDILSPFGNYDFLNCAKRGFQEGIAESFERLVMHDVQMGGIGVGAAAQTVNVGTEVWTDTCGGNDGATGAPFWQALDQALWGNWPTQNVAWIGVDANVAIANAFSYALAMNRGHRLDDLAGDLLDHVEAEQADADYRDVREIFRLHGFADIGDQCAANTNCVGERVSRCDDTVLPSLCIPDNNTGIDGDYCTHNNHCANSNCVGVTPTTGGLCQPGGNIADACETNAGCSGARTSRCDDTVLPSLCIPDNNTGIDGDYCTHNNHCANSNCVGVTPTTGGLCQPGGNIADACETNAGCSGARTSRCDDTVLPSLCIPDNNTGIDGDYCTHNNHCANSNCVGVTPTTGGLCQPGGNIADACETNAGCSGARTSRCDDTVLPSLCIPDNNTGIDGDYCTHNNHCANSNCVGVTPTTGGLCQPGGNIADACETNAGCSGTRTSRCDDTVLPSLCIPNDNTGITGDYCTNNNQCNPNDNLVCNVSNGPGPQPGLCGL